MLGHREAEEQATVFGDVRDAESSRARSPGRAPGPARETGSPPASDARGPETARSVVVLPAPFAPRSATTRPAATIEVEVADDGGGVVAGRQAVDLQHGRAHVVPRPTGPLSPPGARPASTPAIRLAQVRLDDARIAAHLVRRACRDDLAELEHDDAVADAHDEAHVVVDQERRRPGVRDPPEPLTEVLALARVEPGRRLVEAQEPRRASRSRAPHRPACAGPA